MTDPGGPVRGAWPVVCTGCGSQVYNADTPALDPQRLLTGFADTSCPLGGTTFGCPNTTAAVAARDGASTRSGGARVGVVAALTATTAVVTTGAMSVPARRGRDSPIAVGDTVTVQNVSGQWFLTGGPF